MGIVRGIVNYTDFVDMLFDNREDDRFTPIYTRKGEQYSTGFKFDVNSDNVEWTNEKNVVINEFHFASTKKTDFGELAVDIFVISKYGKKNTIIDNMYIKTLYEKKDLLSPFVLENKEVMFINVKNFDKTKKETVYIDIDYYVAKPKPVRPENNGNGGNNSGNQGKIATDSDN